MCESYFGNCFVRESNTRLINNRVRAQSCAEPSSAAPKRVLASLAGHTSVNMTDSMENAGSWTASGSKEAMEVPEELQGFGVRNIAQYSAANVAFPAFSEPTFTFFRTIRHVYRSM